MSGKRLRYEFDYGEGNATKRVASVLMDSTAANVTFSTVEPPIPSQEVPPSFPRSNARCQTIGCIGRLAQVDHDQDEQRYYRIYKCPVCKQYASPRESWVPIDEKPTRAPRKKIRD